MGQGNDKYVVGQKIIEIKEIGMGFLRKQEEQMALRYLRWHYSKSSQPEPSAEVLALKAKEVVDEAHRIAKHRGRNVLIILKEMLAEIKKG